MTRYLLLVHTRPVPGREDEFSRWYDGHLDEVLAVPGFVEARRFDEIDPHTGERGHVAMFSIETTDIEATMESFERSRPTMSTTAALDGSTVRFRLLGSLGPARRRPSPRDAVVR